jgi:hypothetical protein
MQHVLRATCCSGGGSSGRRPARDWPEYWPRSTTPITIYRGGLQPPWQLQASGFTPDGAGKAAASLDSGSASSLSGSGVSSGGGGGGNGSALCGLLAPANGSLVLAAPANRSGAFSDRMELVLWVLVGDRSQGEAAMQAARSVAVNVGSAKGACRAVSLQEVRATGFRPTCTFCTSYWWRCVECVGSGVRGNTRSSVLRCMDDCMQPIYASS